MIVDIAVAISIWFATKWITPGTESWFAWIWYAIKVTCVAIPVTIGINSLIYKGIVKDCVRLIMRKNKG